MEKEVYVFVDLTKEQQKIQFIEMIGAEMVDEFIKEGKRQLLFNMETGHVNMVITDTGEILSNESCPITFVGINDVETKINE